MTLNGAIRRRRAAADAPVRACSIYHQGSALFNAHRKVAAHRIEYPLRGKLASWNRVLRTRLSPFCHHTVTPWGERNERCSQSRLGRRVILAR
jgi:hypothetical protein